MSDITDIREISEIVVVSNLEFCLTILDDRVESTNHLTVAWAIDPGRAESACEEILRVGSEYHFLSSDLGLVVRVQSLFGVFQTLVNVDIVAFAIVHCSGGRSVDELANGRALAALDDHSGTGDIDQFVDLAIRAVCGRGSVNDGRRAGLDCQLCSPPGEAGKNSPWRSHSTRPLAC